jgi:pantothenate synthetase
MTSFEPQEPGSTTILIAANFGTTRLIDNIQL